MRISDWIVCILMAIGALSVVGSVGKPRGPITATTASIVVALDLVLIVALLATH